MSHDEHFRTNANLWNQWTQLHRNSAFYDVDGFRKTRNSLREIEVDALGDVTGKRMLHLQCHFGLDSLSWAVRGADVTGVDLSSEAIDTARELSSELDIPARFECANVYDLEQLQLGRFDIVFTSYGTICWLPDLTRWAQIVAAHLEPGGCFYIVEFHPVLSTLSEDGQTPEYDYFIGDEPVFETERGSYAAPDAPELTSVTWQHSLGELITSLCDAGLRVSAVQEYPYSPYDCFPFTEEVAPGRYMVRNRHNKLPLVYAVRAIA